MTGWSFFFMLLGVTYVTAQIFRLINAIEQPPRRTHGRRAMAR